MGKLFGTDGIRGVANVPPMTVETAMAVGRAVAMVCRKHRDRPRILIGKDTRLSGYIFENALTAGICSMGADALLVGPMPTPGISFITRDMRADAGIVISASHNPYQDNGIKVFSRQGYKIPDDMEREIEAHVLAGPGDSRGPTAGDIGKAHRLDDAMGRYISFCKRTFPLDQDLKGVRVVLDCANGATYRAAPTIFSELGAEVEAIHDEPDGININAGCGSQHIEDLVVRVREAGAPVGLAFDGDGDRLVAVDETGAELNGDHILAICALAMQGRGALDPNLVVLTPMSNLGLRQLFREQGIASRDADVGDRHVSRLMRETGALLGGEQSGHLIFGSHHTTGDGIISALQLLAVMRVSGRALSDLAACMTVAPPRLINIRVREKPPLEDLAPVAALMQRAEADLGDRGRILVRYSGTEPICRVMVEALDDAAADRWSEELAAAVRDAIGDQAAEK